MHFKIRLKELRKTHSLTQADVAAKLEMTERQYQRLEGGISKPSYENLLSIARFFDVSIDFLVNLKGKLFSQPDGTLKYNLRDFKGNILAGEFRYSFGAFKFDQLYVKFFYVQDLEGDIITKIQNSKGSFEFLAFVALVNDTLKLNYEIPKQKNGLYSIDFIVKETDKATSLSSYKNMYLDLSTGKIVVDEMIWGGYESFIREYLEWETEKKVEFLATH